MLDVRIACPRCNKRLKTRGSPAVGQRFRCPRCNHAFAVSDGGARPSPPERTPSRAANGALAAAAAPMRGAGAAPSAASAETVPEIPSNGRALLTITAVAGLFLAAAVGLALA